MFGVLMVSSSDLCGCLHMFLAFTYMYKGSSYIEVFVDTFGQKNQTRV